jgi:hypothetical protein
MASVELRGLREARIIAWVYPDIPNSDMGIGWPGHLRRRPATRPYHHPCLPHLTHAQTGRGARSDSRKP